MLPVTYDPADEFSLPVAVPGMIGDSMFADDVTIPCGASPQPFGTVVGEVAATGISVLPVVNPQGVAIKDDRLAGGRNGQNGYVEKDAMSVRKRGRIWALASGACTKNAVAKYDAATGIFADAGAATLANARFLTANISIPGLLGGATQQVVYVELHDPTVA